MKVAFLNVNAVATGGAEESLALLVLNLPASIKPVLLTFEDGPFVETMRRAGIDVVVHNIHGNLMATKRDGPWFPAMLFVPIEIARLMKTLIGVAPDVIHTDTMRAHLLGSIAGKLLKIPTILHVRDAFEGNARILMRLLAIGLATDYILVSKSLARWYALNADKVVYNPISLDRYARISSKTQARTALNIPSGLPVIGIIGRINRWKGHDRFLRVCALALKQLPLHAIIVGEARNRDFDFIPELKRQIIELGLTDCVSFIPWLDDPRIAYSALDVSVNCSTREPFGRSILEAAACGVPSVCFDDGAFAEIFEDGDIGFCVNAHDEAACADAIVSLLNGPAPQGPIIRCIDRFSTDKHVNTMVKRMKAIQRTGSSGLLEDVNLSKKNQCDR